MGTIEKSQKCHEKSINTRYFVKNTDFQLLNCFDHVYEAIRTWSWKIAIFEPKIVRTDQNHQTWTAFLLNCLVLVFKTMLKTVIFRKILDGDPRKIAKCWLKIEIYEVLCEKHEFSCSERFRPNIRGNSELELKNRDFWTKNAPDRSKSSKVNSFFTQSPRVGVQNHAQNYDFSENLRWGP